jgi:hypothetical protein
MLLAKTLSLSALLVNTVAATTNISQIFYCPYNVKLASPDDPKSLDFEYTPTNAPVNAFMFDGKACLLEVYFFTPDARGDVYLETIEYKSNKAMSIETKLALNAAYAPVSLFRARKIAALTHTDDAANLRHRIRHYERRSYCAKHDFRFVPTVQCTSFEDGVALLPADQVQRRGDGVGLPVDAED